MITLTRSASRIPRARRPQGQRGFARAWLVAAWAMFFVNTALFPCCEAVAAVLGGHANTNNGTQTASVAPPPHHSGDTHSNSIDHSSDSPCDDTQITGLPLVVEYKGLTPDRSSLEWFAVDAQVVTSFDAPPIPSEIFALARASPPPSPRLYLRTQRLLI